MSRIRQSGAARSPVAAMLFEGLPARVRAELIATLPLRTFDDGQFIQVHGDSGDAVWLIEEGSVMVGRYDASGSFGAIAVLGKGDSYGELAVLSGRPRAVDAIARGPARLRAIPVATFEAVLVANPAAMRAMLGALAAQMQEAVTMVTGFRHGTVAARAAALLVNLAGGEAKAVTVTQQEIADLLGLSRATANLVLRELDTAGLIARGYGRLTVADPAGLRSLAIAGRAAG